MNLRTLMIVLLIVPLACVAYWLGGKFSGSQGRTAGSGPDEQNDHVIDFGSVPPGGHAEVTFSLHNIGNDSIAAEDFRTSCDCFKVVLDAQDVPAGETVLARAKVDFKDDPQFSGRLRMTATALCKADKSTAIEVVAYVRVE
jgi:hypothetical protein